MRLLLDTNVVARLIQNGHPQQPSARVAIQSLEAAGHELCLVPQVLYEFWAVATRPAVNNGLGLEASSAATLLRQFRHLFFILRDERTVLDRWETLVTQYAVKGKESHDARLVAAMERHRISHLPTFNVADFRRFTTITTIS